MPRIDGANGSNQKLTLSEAKALIHTSPNNKTLQKIADRLKISVEDLKAKLEHATPAKGKGIYNLADRYGMDMKSFCELNGIDYNKWRDYKAKPNEQFLVYNPNKKDSTKTEEEQRSSGASENSAPKPPKAPITPSSEAPADSPQPTPSTEENKRKYGSSYAPEELGNKIYEVADDTWGAVGKPNFDALLNEINPKNVIEVVQKYPTNEKNDNKESLINTITSEVNSKSDDRKAAVMKIYDTLAKATGAPESVRAGFETELNDQFNSVGMVNTKKLEETFSRMMATPEELALKFKDEFEKYGAVGEESFNELLAFVTPKNAAEVIAAYDSLNTGESLINAITSEVTSDDQARKDAVMHLFNALAEQKGDAKSKEQFETELNDQFNSWGMVNTDKLDDIINDMLKLESKVSSSNNSPASVTNDKRKVHITNNNKTFTVAELQRGAIKSAKEEALDKYKQFCKDNGIRFRESDLDLSPLNRIPAPTIEDGQIRTTESEVLKPKGTPNGKVVILNAGHGGYSSRSGFFDPGAYSFIKKGNGKYAPLVEYEKMQKYAESTAEKLREQGYAVVITSGHSQTMADQDSISNIVSKLNNGTKGGQKYGLDDIAFISLHADSEPGKTGSGICYDSTFSQDTTFAQVLQNNLNQDEWISAGLSERVWGKGGIGVLHQTENIPSVLLEVEYVNGSKCKNLDSAAYQERFENRVITGLNQYFGV